MVRRIAAGIATFSILVVPLSAQRVEVSASGGYTASEGVTVNDTLILGILYNDVEVVSGGSFNFTFGVFTTPNFMIEFQYGRQMSKLRLQGPGLGATTDLFKMSVDGYHGNFVYHWGESDAKVRPFAFAGFGATVYNPGDTLYPGGPNGNFDSNTQFSTTWGAGVKLYPSPHIGVRVTGQWTPTYIKSTSAGYWCDPFYGCWLLADPDYSHQFDISGGITIRF